MIELKNISKQYKTKHFTVDALKDINITIENGDILGIVGESGAGKSTLLRCINLMDPADQGEVLIDGEDLMTMSKSRLRRKRKEIGMIFQHFNLFSQRTIFKNILYPLEYNGKSKRDNAERVQELLKIVGLEHRKDAYPEQLSGGQKQRVAIARALAGNPKLLLCDEATSALDSETTSSILSLLKEVNQRLQLPIILITHEKDVVKEICNKVMILEDGKVAESGDLLSIYTKPQTKVGRAFAGDLLKNKYIQESLKDFIKKDEGKSRIFKLTFTGDKTNDPYISMLSKQFEVLAGILFGNIEIIGGESVGNLIINLQGDPEKIEQGIAFLENQNVVLTEFKEDQDHEYR